MRFRPYRRRPNTMAHLCSVNPTILEVRTVEMPALRSALAALEVIEFPERQASFARSGRLVNKLAPLHEESAAALCGRKRRAARGLLRTIPGRDR